MNNKLIIAAAGSGKTTYIINESLRIQGEKVLITTFTEANEAEIKKKFIKQCGYIPTNITIQTWFALLLQHGVKPYQSAIYEGKINGMILVNAKSGQKALSKRGPIYFSEAELPHHYFNKKMQIYSDKIAKFVCRANEATSGLIIDRISRIYPHIFIDEIQDMAGYDLEFIKLLLADSSDITMVGDPRQVTYHTHDERKYKKYSDGKIEDFILNECSKISVEIDKATLNITYRNKQAICNFANKIYPEYPECACIQQEDTEHDGVYFISPNDVNEYLKKYQPMQLRDKVSVKVNEEYSVMNFGESKGLTFDRVLIYPTKPMMSWILDHSKDLPYQSKSKLYVAITRARHSVGIVYDNKKNISVEGIRKYNNN